MPTIQTRTGQTNYYSDLLWTPVLPGNEPGFLISGTEGYDTLYGSQNADTIYGLGGNDHLYGQGGNDRLVGGLGDDTLNGGAGADVMDGGAGSDWVSYTGSAAVTVDLRDGGFGGHAEGDSYVSIENVWGSSYGDVLLGNAAANTLNGWDGNDQLFGDHGDDTVNGGVGHDRLEGGFGDDTLVGGFGNDTLIGGEGSDTFVFGRRDGMDTIVDFTSSVDKIALDVSRSVQGAPRNPDLFDNEPFGSNGQLARGFWKDGEFLGSGIDGDDKVIYLTDTNQLIAVDDVRIVDGEWWFDGGIILAKFSNNANLATSDFVLV